MENFKIDPSFGQLVEQEMKRRGDTRAAAAAEMDISTSMLSDLLTGRPRNYSMYTLKKICEYGHFSADRILGLTEPADDSTLSQTVNYATGLSPKAAEMLGVYNRSDWAAAKHQRHIVAEAFSDLIRRLSGEADYKKPDGLEFYDTQEPWEGSIWQTSEK